MDCTHTASAGGISYPRYSILSHCYSSFFCAITIYIFLFKFLPDDCIITTDIRPPPASLQTLLPSSYSRYIKFPCLIFVCVRFSFVFILGSSSSSSSSLLFCMSVPVYLSTSIRNIQNINDLPSQHVYMHLSSYAKSELPSYFI